MERIDTIPLAFMKKILSFSGIWPILKPSQRFIRALFISIIFIVSYFVQALHFLSNEFNIKSSVIYTAYLFTTISMGLFYYSSLLKKEYMSSFFTKLLDDWFNIGKTKEYDVLIKYTIYARKCILLWIASYSLYTTLVFLQSFKSVLLDFLIPFNKTQPRYFMYPMSGIVKEDEYFVVVLLIQYFVFLVLGFSIISPLSMYLAVILHICAIFRIIGCLLDNILEDKEKKLKVFDDKVIYTRIIHIIQFHDRAFQLVLIIYLFYIVHFFVTLNVDRILVWFHSKCINSLITCFIKSPMQRVCSFSLFYSNNPFAIRKNKVHKDVSFTLSLSFRYIDAYNTNYHVLSLILVTCALCFIGGATIHIMDTIDKNKKEDIAGLLILPVLYVIFHLIWIFIYCYLGQHLKNVTEAVFYKANETPWYLLSKQSKLLLFLVITRASKPTYVSVGNIFVASHKSFAQLVKLSMSYAMVLHSRN